MDSNWLWMNGLFIRMLARIAGVWTLTKTAEGIWQGTAEGIQGISFDDWMWLLEDGCLLSKDYMTKAGVKQGDVTIFFEKK